MMTVIDAHQHFWSYKPDEYSWISEEMGILKRDFLPEHLEPLLQKRGITGTIAVQARQTVEETRWLLKLAGQYDFIEGVVGWVDLCDPEVGSRLEAFSKHAKFRGVRHVLHDEPDDAFMLRKPFLRGMRILGEFDLTYDILIFPRHLAYSRSLVESLPEQRFVIDHIAKPFIKKGIMEPWSRDIGVLAAFPNVYCKLSGMVTEADWKAWKHEDLKPYIDVVMDTFGANRVMIGSDWPVCTVAGTYDAVLNAAMTGLDSFSEDEKKQVLGATARRFYGVDGENKKYKI